jgi:hypothetical protein
VCVVQTKSLHSRTIKSRIGASGDRSNRCLRGQVKCLIKCCLRGQVKCLKCLRGSSVFGDRSNIEGLRLPDAYLTSHRFFPLSPQVCPLSCTRDGAGSNIDLFPRSATLERVLPVVPNPVSGFLSSGTGQILKACVCLTLI